MRESEEEKPPELPNERQKENIRRTLLRLLADQRGMEIKSVAVRELY